MNSEEDKRVRKYRTGRTVFCILEVIPTVMKQLVLCLLTMTAAINARAQRVERPEITGIASVEIQVSHLDSAVKFYGDYLGYELQRTAHTLTAQVNARQRIYVRDGLPPSQDDRLLSLAFQTTDLARMKAYLTQKGIGVQPGPDNTAIAVKDPDGHTILFVQLPPAKPASGTGISDRILHAGLTIADPARADSFYAAILGFTETWRGGATDSVTSWINMRLPESTDYLEYMLVKPPANRRQLGSAHHIALMVPDMQKAVDALRFRNGSVPSPRIGRNNRWLLNLFDADGTRVELMEPFTAR